MEIINFEDAKARIQAKEKTVEYSPETDDGVLELQKQYRELVRFYEQWYDDYVVGQDENGRWIYKNM